MFGFLLYHSGFLRGNLNLFSQSGFVGGSVLQIISAKHEIYAGFFSLRFKE
jgi:hypothetical protein